jgi:hypothetical protein
MGGFEPRVSVAPRLSFVNWLPADRLINLLSLNP